jgi:hypothetical protein
MQNHTKKEASYDAFVTKYDKVPPIFIFRTLECAETLGDAFDLIADFKHNSKMICWNEEGKIWQSSKDF